MTKAPSQDPPSNRLRFAPVNAEQTNRSRHHGAISPIGQFQRDRVGETAENVPTALILVLVDRNRERSPLSPKFQAVPESILLIP